MIRLIVIIYGVDTVTLFADREYTAVVLICTEYYSLCLDNVQLPDCDIEITLVLFS